MIGSVVLAAAMAAQPVGCADHWLVGLSRESFEHSGAGVTFTEVQLSDFERRVAAALKRAVGEACANGSIAPDKAAAVKDVVVLSASGASEPHFYRIEEGMIAFEYAFAEEALTLPSDEEIVTGAACWNDPDGESCAAMGD
jgi:hypothetical protein